MKKINKSKMGFKERKYVKFCPKCKSLNIKTVTAIGRWGLAFGLPAVYKCGKCMYESPLFPEIELSKRKAGSKNKR